MKVQCLTERQGLLTKYKSYTVLAIDTSFCVVMTDAGVPMRMQRAYFEESEFEEESPVDIDENEIKVMIACLYSLLGYTENKSYQQKKEIIMRRIMEEKL